ncbi:MAG: hypothetical protein AB8G18_09635 [Gammaproteobacteria bacterium]
MVSESLGTSSRNSLYSLAAAGGALLGLFLVGAAGGHFTAVWPAVGSGSELSAGSRFALLLPGLILALTGLVNIVLCRVLWMGVSWALILVLLCNSLAVMYLVYLMLSEVAPNHPIGIFTALVSSYVVLLVALRMGLVWPAVVDS